MRPGGIAGAPLAWGTMQVGASCFKWRETYCHIAAPARAHHLLFALVKLLCLHLCRCPLSCLTSSRAFLSPASVWTCRQPSSERRPLPLQLGRQGLQGGGRELRRRGM